LSGAFAEKHKEAGDEERPKVTNDEITVQLDSFLFPIFAKGGWLTQTPMTVFMDVRGQFNAKTLCRYVPRVRGAITIMVDQNPIVVSENKYQLGDLESRLLQAVNKALKRPLVIRLYVFPLPRQMGEGAGILHLPGNKSNCKVLKKLPDDVAAMVSGEGQEAKTFTIPNPKDDPKNWRKGNFGSAILAEPELTEYDYIPAPIPSEAIPLRQSDLIGKAAPDPGQCQKLSTVWSPGFHEVSGRRYWLHRAFTLDDDANGIVDNIGFILKADDRPDLYIYYFPSPGKQSVITAPTLRLTDDRGVLRICFGQEKFENPREEEKTKPGAFKAPDLASELAAKQVKSNVGNKNASGPGAVGAPVQEKLVWDGPVLIFIVLAGAGFLIIIVGGVGYALAKRRTDRRKKARRKKTDRRGQDRRQRQQPPEGGERRTEESRRQEEARRQGEERRGQDEDRRDEKDRRQ
jgi:hypothetical protein